MKILVGLGNPGTEYEGTRHNFGADVVSALAEAQGEGFKNAPKLRGEVCQFEKNGAKILLLKPLTFMNLSGESVAKALGFYKCPLSSLLVVYDELDIPLGRIKFAESGSSGGHNGIKSIIEQVGSKDFHRLRLGIGKSKTAGNTVGHVLSGFRSEERQTAQEVLERALKGIEYYLDHGIQKTMNQFNQQ